MSISASSSLLIDYSNKTNVKKESAKTVSWWGNITRLSVPIRSANVHSKLITSTFVDYCVKAGYKPVITIETDDTYSITCTPDTFIFGNEEWVRADLMEVGDTIYTNGVPDDGAWRDYDTIKRLYVEEDRTMKEVGTLLGVSEHTIRKWVRKHGLGKDRGGKLFGVENPNYKGGDATREGGYQRMNALVDEGGIRTGTCSSCDAVGSNMHMHHIDHNPLNNDPSNLTEICPACHRIEHVGYTIKHIKRSEVTEIYLSGVQMTYDLCTEQGTFVSEGFIIMG